MFLKRFLFSLSPHLKRTASHVPTVRFLLTPNHGSRKTSSHHFPLSAKPAFTLYDVQFMMYRLFGSFTGYKRYESTASTQKSTNSSHKNNSNFLTKYASNKGKRYAFWISFLMGMLVVIYLMNNQRKSRTTLTDIIKLLAEKETDKAIQLLIQYSEENPELKDVLEELQKGNFQSAEYKLDDYFSGSVFEHEYYFLKGLLFHNMGQYQRSLDSFARAVQLNGNNIAEVYFHRGNLLNDMKLYDEAILDYDRALLEKPDFTNAYIKKGFILSRNGDFEGAVACYDKAIALDSENRVALFSRNISLDPAYVYSTKALWLVFYKGLYDEAIVYFDKAIILNPKDFALYNNKAICLSRKGDYEGAVECYNKAISLNPEMTSLYFNRGIAFANKGNPKDAILSYNKALALGLKKVHHEEHPDIAMHYSKLGEAYQYLEDSKTALEYHEKALKIQLKVCEEKHPDIAISYNNLAETYQSLGDVKKAIEYYEKALEIRLKLYGETDSDVGISYSNLGEAYRTLGNTEKALDLQKKALMIQMKVNSDDPHIAISYNRLGLIYQGLRAPKKAIECHRKAVAINLKFYGELHLNTALAYERLGTFYQDNSDYEGAKFYLERALHIYRHFDRQQSVSRVQHRLETLAFSHLLGYIGTLFSSRSLGKQLNAKPTSQTSPSPPLGKQSTESPRSRM